MAAADTESRKEARELAASLLLDADEEMGQELKNLALAMEGRAEIDWRKFCRTRATFDEAVASALAVVAEVEGQSGGDR